MKYTFSETAKITGGKIIDGTAAKDLIFDFFSTDSRKDCRNSMFFPLPGEKFDSHDFIGSAIASGAKAICVAKNKLPNLNLPENISVLAVDDTLKAYQTLANHHRRKINPKIIALTGSSGKTSAKEILKAILVHAFGAEAVYATIGNTNNHVGVPQNLLNLTEKHGYAIIEMGTNHFGEIEVLGSIAEPDIAIIVSIGNAHLEFFKDPNGVAKEKSAIFAKLSAAGTAVIPAEGPGLGVLADAVKKIRTLRFGTDKAAPPPDVSVNYLGSSFKGSRFELARKNCEFRRVIEWPLLGRHQAMNAAAASLAAEAAGIDLETIADALSSGISLPGMRMNAADRDGVTWINDAYNANPDSMRAGIEWLAEALGNEKPKGRAFVVLGDMLELGPSGPLAHRKILDLLVEKIPAAVIVTVGPIMDAASEAIRSDTSISIRNFQDSTEAGKYIRSKLKKDDIIYLKGSRGIALEKVLCL